jgi:hypothetical protein
VPTVSPSHRIELKSWTFSCSGENRIPNARPTTISTFLIYSRKTVGSTRISQTRVQNTQRQWQLLIMNVATTFYNFRPYNFLVVLLTGSSQAAGSQSPDKRAI